ncbi:DUF4357 domain-containing protein, partial [Chlamydiota bacterium]
VKFLEWFCYTEAEKTNRYRLDNSTIPTKSHVSESLKSDLLDNFETIKVLITTLGYPVFEKIIKPEKKDILFCKGKDAFAEGEFNEDGLVVFKGSKCNIKESKSAVPWVVNMRRKLVSNGVFKKEGNVYILTQDHIFSSPSAAAVAVLGRSANGWTEWIYKDGKTLDEVKRSKD